MSSGGGDGGATPTTAAQTMYFCYQCNCTICISSSYSELVCPNCNGGFLELVDNNNINNSHVLPHPSLFNPFFTSPSPISHPILPFLVSSPTPTSDHLDMSSVLGRSPFQESDAVNPFQLFQTYLQTMGGPNLQFVIENAADQLSPNARSLRLSLPANIGDYFIGPGLEQVIQQLSENDPNRHGTPPASKVVVEDLPNIVITKEILDSDSSQCAVCMDDFNLGSQVKQMPCNHFYHSHCLLPWLELHSSCPVCRYQLPTDDPEYDNQRNQTSNNNVNAIPTNIRISNNNNNNNNNNDNNNNNMMENDRSVERRFTISLPLSITSSPDSERSQTSHTSPSSAGATDGPTNRSFGSETRQEDHD